MRIEDMPKETRPRERLLKFGVGSLTNSELLAVILRTGIKGESVMDLSNHLLKDYSLEGLRGCSLNELKNIRGMGITKAMQILAITELTARQLASCNPIKKVSSSNDIFELFNERLKYEKQEKFYVVCLDGKCRIIKEELVATGILDALVIHPREVFKTAIKEGASTIILVHNHPSGDSLPSVEDLKMIKTLDKCGKTLGIPVLDQIIIGRDNNWSLKDSLKDINI